MNDIKTLIEKYVALLPVGTSVSYTEAERRAGEFLVAQASITDLRHILNNEKIKLLSVQTATFTLEMAKQDAKTITEKKMFVEASEAYTKAREELEAIDNDLAYLKAYYEIFGNGHIFFRNMAKGESL